MQIEDRNADGNLYVRYLNWNGDRWDWNYNWLDNDWNESNPSAVSATFNHSSAREVEVFLFLTSSLSSSSRPFVQLLIASLRG